MNFSFIFWPEMLSRPFLILNGWLPYRDIVMEHAPLLPVVLAGWFKLFGLGFLQLQIFTWIIIGLTASLVKKFYSNLAALIYLMLVFAYQGNGLWYDLALTPVILTSFILLNRQKYLASGIVLGLAFFTKQTAIWLFLGFVYFVHKDKEATKQFLLGITSTTLGSLVVMWAVGILPDFLKWASVVRAPFLWPTPAQFIYAFSPFIVLLLNTKYDIPYTWKIRIMAIFSALGVFPRWELLHFQPALPYLAILLAGFFALPNKILTKSLLIVLLSGFVFRQYSQIINQPDRFRELEFLQTVEYVKKNTRDTDRILVLNTWESMYALAGRLPVSKPLYPYLPWYLNIPGAQESITSNLESVKASVIVIGQTQSTGLGSYIPSYLDAYIKKNYHQTDKIGSLYVWQP